MVPPGLLDVPLNFESKSKAKFGSIWGRVLAKADEEATCFVAHLPDKPSLSELPKPDWKGAFMDGIVRAADLAVRFAK